MKQKYHFKPMQCNKSLSSHQYNGVKLHVARAPGEFSQRNLKGYRFEEIKLNTCITLRNTPNKDFVFRAETRDYFSHRRPLQMAPKQNLFIRFVHVTLKGP